MEVTARARLVASSAEVWNRVGDFGAIADWHPAIETTELEQDGRVRRNRLAGGGESVERLLQRDRDDRSYSYAMLEGPLPVAGYRATLSVEDTGDHESIVIWRSEFEVDQGAPAEVAENVREFLQAGLDHLERSLGS